MITLSTAQLPPALVIKKLTDCDSDSGYWHLGLRRGKSLCDNGLHLVNELTITSIPDSGRFILLPVSQQSPDFSVCRTRYCRFVGLHTTEPRLDFCNLVLPGQVKHSAPSKLQSELNAAARVITSELAATQHSLLSVSSPYPLFLFHSPVPVSENITSSSYRPSACHYRDRRQTDLNGSVLVSDVPLACYAFQL